MKILLPIACLLGASLQAAAQTAPPTDTLHVQTRLVVLDAVVTGKDGQPVAGLGAGDFAVQEDGKTQAIKHVEYATVSSASASARPAQAVFVMDGLNSSLEESAYGRAQLLRYLSAQPETLAAPAMLVAVNDRGFRMLAPYTRDRGKLQAAAQAFQLGIPYDFKQHAYEERLTITFDALRQIALANSGTPVRTELVWLGHGFPAVTLAKLPQGSAETLRNSVASITNLLLDARIVLYKVEPAPVGSPAYQPDPTDLESAFDESPEPYADSISFDGIVIQTGGQSFFNRNDVHAELAKAVELGASFYTIAYTPTSNSDAAAAYRHIRITVQRPGLKVATRLGYFTSAAAKPAAPVPTDPHALLDAAIINNLPYTALHFQVKGFSQAVAGVTHCTLRLLPESASWVMGDDGARTIQLLAGVVVYDGRGKFLAYLRDGVTLHDESLLFDLNLRLPVNAASLRVVVLDTASGKLGSVAVGKIPGGALGR